VASTTSAKPSETLAFARQLAPGLKPGDVVALCGDLGAGKTQFVKGLAEGLGYLGDVTSPTFTLIHEYFGGLMPLYHFDFYRLETEAEVLAVGLEEYLASDGVCVFEWADKFRDLLPAHTRWFHLSISGENRRMITERA
jgi:tRNA threonylcarbamoyladenosine biosynthesis protein TsaE